jgi:hypothetical protein
LISSPIQIPFGVFVSHGRECGGKAILGNGLASQEIAASPRFPQ